MATTALLCTSTSASTAAGLPHSSHRCSWAAAQRRRRRAAPASSRLTAFSAEVQDETLSGDNDGGGGGEVVLEVFVERTGTLPAHSGGGSKSNKNERKSLRDFATSDGATRAMLTGGPGTPEQLGPSTWRVRAHGFGGRLFFVGPVTRLNPVSDFKLVTGDGGCEEEGVNSVTMRMEQTSGGIEGTPPGVVRWINRAYRAEKTVTTVTVDAAAGTVVASLDLRLVLAVPSAFRLVPKRKIEAAMRDALTFAVHFGGIEMEVNHLRECPCFEAPTEKALGEVCDAVSEAYAAWDDAVAADAMVA